LEATRLLGLCLDTGPITYEQFLSPIISYEKERVQQEIENSLHLNKSFRINYRVILPDGSQRYILNHGEILYDEKGNPEIMLGAIQDVSELREAEEEIHRLAFHDSLTGLANRMLFLDRLTMEVTSAKRKEQLFALLFLDLDQFKRVNDSYGHHIGDLLLKDVAENMKKCIRSTDTNAIFTHQHPETIIARIGGDEFTILLSDIKTPENAALVSRRIIDAVSSTYNLEGHEILMTTSIGIAIFPVDGNESEILLKNADSAMYQAKTAGRNNYQFYDERLNTEAIERAVIEQDVRMALERDEFVLYYQPQIEFSTGKIVGAEALIRWLHPVKGMVPPDRFIPIAEGSGLISSINEWVIKSVCKQSSQCSSQGYKTLRLAVNLSGHQFLSQKFIEVVKDNILARNVDPQNIKLEITENTILQNAEDSIAILEQMRDHHISVVLDDFGTGYSSLSYLTSFPVDTIKIDRSFVMGCTRQTKNMLIIKATIAMGHSLGMKVIAEGVETREQFDILKGLGCDEGQGYYFSPPIPPDEFEKMLARGQL
jgi:diguanylate cyclase (GGDEF)-like protein